MVMRGYFMAERKKREEWELLMIGEWLSKTFPDARYQTRVRLGQTEPRLPDGRYTPEEVKYLGVWRRYVDAIVFLSDRLLLIEAVLRAHPGKLSILKLYERLIPHTPELAEWSHLPIQKVLLYAIEDPVLTMMAKEEGTLAVQFVPSFFDRWFETLRGRDQRAPES